VKPQPELFCTKGDLQTKKTSQGQEDSANVKANDEYLDILKRIYQLIKTAGSGGIEYRQIIKKLDLSQQLASKFEDYLLSHYCRKLVNIGLIEIQSKSLSNKTNIRYAIDSIYCDDAKKKENEAELLGNSSSNPGKRNYAKLEQGEEEEEGMEHAEGEEFGVKTHTMQHSLAQSHYYPRLTYIDNLRLNLMGFQAHFNKGLTTTELNNLLVTNHRKKTITRSLENLQKLGLKSEAARSGRNYFLKYLYEVESIKEEVESKGRSTTPGGSAAAGFISARRSRVLSEVKLHPPNEVVNELLKELNSEEEFSQVYREMMLVLLSKVCVLSKTEKPSVFKNMIESFLLSDLIHEYKNFFKDQEHPVSSYAELRSKEEELEQKSASYRDRKYIDQIHFHRLLSFLLEFKTKIKSEDPNKKKKKIHTQSRVERLVYIWKKVKESQKISLIDLSNMISNELEKGLPFKVDKKTIVNLVKDLEVLGVVILTKFQIKIESQKIVDLVTIFKRGIVSDAFVNLTDEMIADDPSIQNPTFRRVSKLPKSLEFLAATTTKDKDKEPMSRRIRIGTSEKRGQMLDRLFEKAIKQEEVSSEDKAVLDKSKTLYKVIKAAELRLCSKYITVLRANKGLRVVSEAVRDFRHSESVTDKFLQNKFKVSVNDYGYISQLLFDSSLTASTKTQAIPSQVQKYFSEDDKIVRDCEASTIMQIEKQTKSTTTLQEVDFEKLLPTTTNLKSKLLRNSSLISHEEQKEGVFDDEQESTSLSLLDTMVTSGQKNTNLTLTRLANMLKRTHPLPVQTLDSKFKHPHLLQTSINLLQLQGDLEESAYLDASLQSTPFKAIHQSK
jgi:hypothetical protein